VLVRERVCDPAGLEETGFLRSGELPRSAALGYLDTEGPRTNEFHLPVLGSGDGGICSTVADISARWRAFVGGRVVSPELVGQMLTPAGARARRPRVRTPGVALSRR